MPIEWGPRFDIEARMGYLPKTLLKDVWDKIIPNQSGVILPWFPKWLYWNDETHWHRQRNITDSVRNQITHISQWNELDEYLELKWFDEKEMLFHKKAIFRVLDMNSEIIGATWPYLIMGEIKPPFLKYIGRSTQTTHSMLVRRDATSVEIQNEARDRNEVFKLRLNRRYG